MTYLGLSGVVPTSTDDPSQANQGTCPQGYAQAYGVCIQVETTAPSGLIETDPNKLPPASRLTTAMLVAVGLLGAVVGAGVHFFHKR